MATRQTAKPAIHAGHRATVRLLQQIVSGWRSQALSAAIRTGLIDRLAEPRQPAQGHAADELAQALGCHPQALCRLLRALCALGVCSERGDSHFVLTRTGRLLAPESADGTGSGNGYNLRALALWWGGPLWPVWGELEYSVRTGQSARLKLTGDANYAYLDKDGTSAPVFHEAQRAMTALILDDLVSWSGWHGARTMVDVGGGHGQIAVAMLAAHSGLSATVYDLPNAQAGAARLIDAAGLADRCRFQPGSFFDSVPAGADCYLLKSILHNWDDNRCAVILQRLRDAMPTGSRLALVERLRPQRLRPGARDEGLARTDLNMLAGLGGRERTIGEYSAMLNAARLTVTRVVPTAFEFSLVEARPDGG